METIESIYINAILASASYADNLRDGASRSELKLLLEEKEWPSALAEFLSGNFEVATNIETSDVFGSGFDATVWRGLPGTPYAGKLYLSIRGTDGLGDWLADAQLILDGDAGRQIIDMMNWWERITTSEGANARQWAYAPDPETGVWGLVEYTAAGTGRISAAELAAGVEVNGHSLGGYLASAFTRLFGSQAHVRQTTTFNSAGFAEGSAAAFNTLTSAIGAGNGRAFPLPGDPAQINVFAAKGLDVTTNSFYFEQMGLRVGVFIEEGTRPDLNHSMYRLTDALALAAMLQRLDPSLTVARFNAVLESGSEMASASLEKVVDGLRRLFLDPATGALPIGDADGNAPNRTVYYATLRQLSTSEAVTALAGHVRIHEGGTIVGTAARSDFGLLAALLCLSPVVLSPASVESKTVLDSALHAVWGQTFERWEGERALAPENQGKEVFTNRWMRDRAAMLNWLGFRNTREIQGVVATSAAGKSLDQPIQYKDFFTGTEVLIGAVNPDHRRQVLFGDHQNNPLSGYEKADSLYGAAGDDVLKGLGGADYLEGNDDDDTLDGGEGSDILVGGADMDAYRFAAGWGNDTIVDSDGAGTVHVDGIGPITGAGARKVGSNVWQTSDRVIKYTLVDVAPGQKDVIVTFSDRVDTIRIQGWESARSVGVTLDDAVSEAPVVSNSFVGDYAKKTNAGSYVFDGANYASDGPEPNAQDLLKGTSDNDSLRGMGGNDALSGYSGDDLIDGGEGDDLLFGGLGADIISGGGGRDFIYGSGSGALTYPLTTSQGAPTPPGPEYTRGFSWVTYDAGVDSNGFHTYGIKDTGNSALSTTLDGDAGNFINGDAGDDWIRSGSGDDVVHGGLDNDNIVGLAGKDVLFGDDGNDAIWGDGIDTAGYEETVSGDQHGNDLLVGGTGNDDLYGQGGDDALYGGDNDDVLSGDDSDTGSTPLANHGSDWLDGGGGSDQLLGGGASDHLLGGAGNDTLVGDNDIASVPGTSHGDDWLDGGADNDQIVGGGAADTLLGGQGNDQLWGDQDDLDGASQGADHLDAGDGDDYLDGGGDADLLLAGAGNDTLHGGDGADALYGDAGVDQLSGGDGDDHLEAGGGADTLVGGDGNDRMHGGADDDLMAGGAGDDVLLGENGADQLQGGDGKDELLGGTGNDLLFGEADDDQLNGADDDDQLVGGAGHDSLYGDTGRDQLFGDEGDDTLDGGAGDDDLVAGAGNDTLTGGAGVDRLWGIAGNNRLDGDEGDDFLTGGTGDDTLVGGLGRDYLSGGGGNDTYVFGYGDSVSLALAETIDDAAGANRLVFNEEVEIGNVAVNSTALTGYWSVTAGHSVVLVKDIRSGAMAEFQVGSASYAWQPFLGSTLAMPISQSTSVAGSQLVGGKLSDSLNGYGGGTTFWGGRGNDSFWGDAGNNVYVFNVGDGFDLINERSRLNPTSIVRFGTGITSDQVSLSYSGSSLYVNFAGRPTDRVELYGFNPSNPTGSLGITRFDFADGQILLFSALVARGIAIAGTSGDDTLSGTASANTLDGGAGNDTLCGKGGDDTYVFRRGYGNDLLADQDPAFGTGDRLLFDSGITSADLLATRYQSDLVLRLVGTSDSVRLKDWFFAASPDRVEGIEFADGIRLLESDVDTLLASSAGQPILGTIGNDILYGTPQEDLIDGGAGDDSAYGDAGDDTLVGTQGVDRLYGQSGGDTYVVAQSSGWVTVDETGSDGAGVDTLQFIDGIRRSDLSILDSDDRVRFWIPGRSDFHIIVDGQLSADSSRRIERFVFADGEVLTAQQLKDSLLTGTMADDDITAFASDDAMWGGWGHDRMYGQGGIDFIHGNEGNDTLYGGTGADVVYGDGGADGLYGEDGNDLLDGGAGGDRLNAGTGDDTYAFGYGHGNDIIVRDDGGTDVVELASGITAANVSLHRISSPAANDLPFNGDSLVIQLNGSADQLWISDYFASATQGYVERIRFADGTAWDFNAISSRLVTLGGTPNTMVVTRRDDAFVIDHWNDLVDTYGGTPGGIDTVRATVGYRPGDSISAEDFVSYTLAGPLNLFVAVQPVFYDAKAVYYGNAGDNVFEQIDPVLRDPQVFTFRGGAGNDTYISRSSDDEVIAGTTPSPNMVAIELAGEGTDTWVTGFWSFTLPDNVEILEATTPNPVASSWLTFDEYGSNDLTHRFSGNSLDNVIDATVYEAAGVNKWWYAYRNAHLTGAGTYRLDGGAGADRLIGGRGDDVYVIDDAGDVFIETGVDKSGDRSIDTIETPFATDLAQHANIENVTLVGSAAVAAWGTSGSNALDGSRNLAANEMTGGAGDDTYTVGIGDVVHEQADEGHDTVVIAAAAGPVHIASYANVEALRVSGAAGNLAVVGDEAANILTGSLGDNSLDGGGGDDQIFDQHANDTLTYSGQLAVSDADLLNGGNGNDTLTSYGGNDVLDGGADNDALLVHGRVSAAGNQASAVTVRFGLGDGQDSVTRSADPLNSYLVEFKDGVAVRDVTLNAAGSTLVITLPDGSALRLTSALDAYDTTRLAPGLGLSLEAEGILIGPEQVQAMLRTTDRSTPTGVADFLLGTSAHDSVDGLDGNDLVLGMDGNDLLAGGAGSDALFGGIGSDILSGGADDDTLAGGAGADLYRLSRGFGHDVISDRLTTLRTAGTDDGAVDTVEFDSTVGSADIAVYRLVAGATVTGLVLAARSNGDTVDLQDSYLQGAAGAIEQVRFTDGITWNLDALKARVAGETGGEGNDTLTGSAAADTLDGRGGSDTMSGLAGDDTYHVDIGSDVVNEAANAGADRVIASASYTLPVNVERLSLAGSAPLDGVGNALANELLGNSAANRLDGGTGADTMRGGGGDDTYVVETTSDQVVENAGDGRDTVETGLTYTLGNNVENLRLIGTGKVKGTGNALDNVLTGNSSTNTLTGNGGNDWLDGGASADILVGGAGDDVYVVDNASDSTKELAGGGYDSVVTQIAWTLSGEVERLFLGNTIAVNGTGNNLHNWLVGNGGVNTIDGAAGNDVLMGRGANDTVRDTSGSNALDGGAGVDTVTGGTGNDLLAGGQDDGDVLVLGGGSDVVAVNADDRTDTVSAPMAGAGAGERNDTISIGKARLTQIGLAREGNDLLVKTLVDWTGGLRLKDWYASANHQTVARLQVIVDSSADYAPTSGDTLRSSRVLLLDFATLVAAFDAAKAADPWLGNWMLSDTQLLAARVSASDADAIGGALAYRYGNDGTFSNVAPAVASSQLGASFGTQVQSIATTGAGGGQLPMSTPLVPMGASKAVMTESLNDDSVASSSLDDTQSLGRDPPAALALAVSADGDLVGGASAILPVPSQLSPVLAAARRGSATLAPIATNVGAASAPRRQDANAGHQVGSPQPESRASASLASRDQADIEVGAPRGEALQGSAELFPATSLSQYAFAAQHGDDYIARTVHSKKVHLRWNAVDAWADLERATRPQQFAGDESWSLADGGEGLAVPSDTTRADLSGLRVNRLDHAEQFRVARFR